MIVLVVEFSIQRKRIQAHSENHVNVDVNALLRWSFLLSQLLAIFVKRIRALIIALLYLFANTSWLLYSRFFFGIVVIQKKKSWSCRFFSGFVSSRIIFFKFSSDSLVFGLDFKLASFSSFWFSRHFLAILSVLQLRRMLQ